MYLLSDRTSWLCSDDYRFSRLNEHGDWEIILPEGVLEHGDYFRLYLKWKGGEGDRIPAYATRVEQDSQTYIYCSRMWNPAQEYKWSVKDFTPSREPVIYEAHIGMAAEHYGIGTFNEFRENVLPRIISAGFNTVQFMALMEHPYYGSFGYQVANFFALSSKYGTPDEFKFLVDECHRNGVAVIMDLVHSHAVKNELEGLSNFDGTPYLYFHEGPRGYHPAWDSRCFDYSNSNVINFLLSNCVYWIEEYHIDGYRFDGVTSMLYHDHGLGASFDNYDKYFGANTDEDAVCYLSLANHLIHSIKPDFITIAEDMSGMPGMAREAEAGGCGFDYRLAMGIPDFWIKLLKEKSDEQWSPGEIWGVLNNRRFTEKHIAYSESHDQALVGDKTLIFRMLDSAMYTDMSIGTQSLTVSRGIALIKIINMLTFSLGGDGYMCFMGNEFGHPEWIDFPREGNGWSYHYARRQWSLSSNRDLRYGRILEFTGDMLHLCSDVLKSSHPGLLCLHEDDQVLAYSRGELYFIVNMSGTKSYRDYRINVPAGSYHLLLDSDSEKYDGSGRIPGNLVLKAADYKSDSGWITPYLPTRTVLVFRRTSPGG